jgi:AcrR family transcriptional regulator
MHYHRRWQAVNFAFPLPASAAPAGLRCKSPRTIRKCRRHRRRRRRGNFAHLRNLAVLRNFLYGQLMPEEQPGLRERKKQATRSALALAAWRLTIERGYEQTRIEDIAAAVGVSARTFSNYFSSKEEALLSVGADRGARTVAALRARPDSEPLWQALAHVMAKQFAGDGAVARADAKAIAYPPDLAAAQRRLHASIEDALAAVIADRTGTRAERDLYPRLLAAVVVSATQTAFDHWRTSDSTLPFAEVVRDVLGQVSAGLPAPPAQRPPAPPTPAATTPPA